MTIIRTPLVGTILKNLPSATKIPFHVTGINPSCQNNQNRQYLVHWIILNKSILWYSNVTIPIELEFFSCKPHISSYGDVQLASQIHSGTLSQISIGVIKKLSNRIEWRNLVQVCFGKAEINMIPTPLVGISFKFYPLPQNLHCKLRIKT